MGAQTLKMHILQLQDYENYTLHLTYPAKKSLYDDRTEQVTKTLHAAQALAPCGELEVTGWYVKGLREAEVTVKAEAPFCYVHTVFPEQVQAAANVGMLTRMGMNPEIFRLGERSFALKGAFASDGDAFKSEGNTFTSGRGAYASEGNPFTSGGDILASSGDAQQIADRIEEMKFENREDYDYFVLKLQEALTLEKRYVLTQISREVAAQHRADEEAFEGILHSLEKNEYVMKRMPAQEIAGSPQIRAMFVYAADLLRCEFLEKKRDAGGTYLTEIADWKPEKTEQDKRMRSIRKALEKGIPLRLVMRSLRRHGNRPIGPVRRTLLLLESRIRGELQPLPGPALLERPEEKGRSDAHVPMGAEEKAALFQGVYLQEKIRVRTLSELAGSVEEILRSQRPDSPIRGELTELREALEQALRMEPSVMDTNGPLKRILESEPKRKLLREVLEATELCAMRKVTPATSDDPETLRTLEMLRGNLRKLIGTVREQMDAARGQQNFDRQVSLAAADNILFGDTGGSDFSAPAGGERPNG